MRLLTYVFIRGVIAPKWFARATFLPQNGLHAQFFCPISLSQAIAPIQVGRSDLNVLGIWLDQQVGNE